MNSNYKVTLNTDHIAFIYDLGDEPTQIRLSVDRTAPLVVVEEYQDVIMRIYNATKDL